MVTQLLRLKLRLLGNTFRRRPWQLVGIGIGLLYGLGFAVFVVVGLIGLRFADVEVARTIVVLGGSLAVLGFLLVPLAFGTDDTLDPRRFALFGIDNTRLAAGLLLSALVGVPALVVAAVSLATVVTWSRNFGAVLLALIGAGGVLLTCVLAARVTTSVAAYLLSTRRAREVTGLLGILAVLSVSPVVVLLGRVDWRRNGLDVAARISDTLGWTPLGAVWAFPADAAAGNWGSALLKLLIAAAFLGVLWLGWRALVAQMLVSPARVARMKSYGGLGWFDRTPGTPTGAIAARSATYWFRDPRYRVSLIMIPIAPFLMIIPLLVAGVPVGALVLIPLPMMCLFLGWALHNDVAYDNTAVWLHVASGVSGRADRLGRLFPVFLFGLPLIFIGSVLTSQLYGSTDLLPALLGVSACLLFAGAGFSSIMSARFPYPVVRPGDSPFSQPQNSGATQALVQSVSFSASLVLAAPALAFAALGMLLDSRWYVWSLLAGVTVGLATLAVGVLWGARIFDRRGPELIAAALQG